MSAFDWNEIAQAKKIVKTSDQTLCGNVVAEYKDNIIIIAHGPKLHEYMTVMMDLMFTSIYHTVYSRLLIFK